MAEVFESPLEKFPGSFELLDYDDFDGTHWDIWRELSDKNDKLTMNRFFAYAGAEFIKKIGKWDFESPTIDEFLGWQKDKKAERVRFVSWVGKCVSDYITELIDPKG